MANASLGELLIAGQKDAEALNTGEAEDRDTINESTAVRFDEGSMPDEVPVPEAQEVSAAAQANGAAAQGVITSTEQGAGVLPADAEAGVGTADAEGVAPSAAPVGAVGAGPGMSAEMPEIPANLEDYPLPPPVGTEPKYYPGQDNPAKAGLKFRPPPPVRSEEVWFQSYVPDGGEIEVLADGEVGNKADEILETAWLNGSCLAIAKGDGSVTVFNVLQQEIVCQFTPYTNGDPVAFLTSLDATVDEDSAKELRLLTMSGTTRTLRMWKIEGDQAVLFKSINLPKQGREVHMSIPLVSMPTAEAQAAAEAEAATAAVQTTGETTEGATDLDNGLAEEPAEPGATDSAGPAVAATAGAALGATTATAMSGAGDDATLGTATADVNALGAPTGTASLDVEDADGLAARPSKSAFSMFKDMEAQEAAERSEYDRLVSSRKQSYKPTAAAAATEAALDADTATPSAEAEGGVAAPLATGAVDASAMEVVDTGAVPVQDVGGVVDDDTSDDDDDYFGVHDTIESDFEDSDDDEGEIAPKVGTGAVPAQAVGAVPAQAVGGEVDDDTTDDDDDYFGAHDTIESDFEDDDDEDPVQPTVQGAPTQEAEEYDDEEVEVVEYVEDMDDADLEEMEQYTATKV